MTQETTSKQHDEGMMFATSLQIGEVLETWLFNNTIISNHNVNSTSANMTRMC
jgi:hypothetical protein